MTAQYNNLVLWIEFQIQAVVSIPNSISDSSSFNAEIILQINDNWKKKICPY